MSFKQTIRLDPDYRYGYSFLARVYSEIGEYKKAIKLRKKILNNDPYDISTHIQLGFNYVNMGDIDSAFEVYKRLKELNKHGGAKALLDYIDKHTQP